MSLFEHIRFAHPILRVNNRDRNIEFYETCLGFKLVSEENAIAIFSDYGHKTSSFIIEESPSMRTRAVEGIKKVNRISVKAENPDEIAALLANGATAQQVFKGKKGYAYETLSPEGDLFLLHAEDDINDLQVIARPNLPVQPEIKGLSAYHFERIVLNVSDLAASKNFYQTVFDGQSPLKLEFVEAKGADLAVEPNVTWDLEIMECQVPKDYDLTALRDYFISKNLAIYLDKKENILVISDPSQIEIWFVK